MQILSAGHINYWSLERSVGLGGAINSSRSHIKYVC